MKKNIKQHSNIKNVKWKNKLLDNENTIKKNITLLWENDKIYFEKNKDDLVKKSKIFISENIEPTIHEYNKISKDILYYIKNKKRIIYGGYSLLN